MPGHSPFMFVPALSYDSYTKMLDLALAHIDTKAKCSGSPPSFASFHALRLFCTDNLTISGSGVMPDFCKAQGILFSDHPLHRLDNRTNMIGAHIQTPLRVMQKTPISALPTATSSSSSSSSTAVQHTQAFVFSRMLLETTAFSAVYLQLMFFDNAQFGIFCNDQCVETGQYRSHLDVARLVHRFYLRELCVGYDMTGDDLDLENIVMHSIRRGVGHVVRHISCEGAFNYSRLSLFVLCMRSLSVVSSFITGSLELNEAPIRGRCKHCVTLVASLSRARRNQDVDPDARSSMVSSSSRTTFANLTSSMKTDRMRNLSSNLHSQKVLTQFHRVARSISTPVSELPVRCAFRVKVKLPRL